MELETRFFETRFNTEKRKVSGYGIVFYDGTPGTEYQLGPNLYERIAPNAFELDDVSLLLMHERKQPLARTPKTLRLQQDGKGIRFDADILKTRAGEDAVELLANDYIRGSSPGFYVTKREFSKEGNKEIVTIRKGELKEISLVDSPAYASTTAALRHYEDWKQTTIEHYEKRLALMLNSLK